MNPKSSARKYSLSSIIPPPTSVSICPQEIKYPGSMPNLIPVMTLLKSNSYALTVRLECTKVGNNVFATLVGKPHSYQVHVRIPSTKSVTKASQFMNISLQLFKSTMIHYLTFHTHILQTQNTGRRF